MMTEPALPEKGVIITAPVFSKASFHQELTDKVYVEGKSLKIQHVVYFLVNIISEHA